MGTPWLTEKTVSLIQDQIKAGIAGALASVRAQRADKAVSTEPPPTQSYFIFEGAKAYRCPAIFMIADSMDMHNADRGANFIAARARIIVSVIVEDRRQDLLTLKAWRYQAALHQLLHLATLTTADQKVRVETKVERVLYSHEFTDAVDKDVPQGVFRKEVALHLDAEHFENL
jgi:hypothetical protein